VNECYELQIRIMRENRGTSQEITWDAITWSSPPWNVNSSNDADAVLTDIDVSWGILLIEEIQSNLMSSSFASGIESLLRNRWPFNFSLNSLSCMELGDSLPCSPESTSGRSILLTQFNPVHHVLLLREMGYLSRCSD